MRSKTNPLGRRDSVAVQVGNLLCARALVLILIIAAKGCFWVLEQPGTSVMELHPLFQALLRLLPGVVKKTINMSSFGAPTKKRTLLYASNFAFKKASIFFEGLCSNSLNAIVPFGMRPCLYHISILYICIYYIFLLYIYIYICIFNFECYIYMKYIIYKYEIYCIYMKYIVYI